MKKEKIYIFAILVLGFLLRTYNIDWDQGAHLHPDERFLTMVGIAISLPKNILDYFNVDISTFNPANVDYKFFVYGTLPIFLNKIVALILGNDNYTSFTIQGRFLSALADTLTILLTYKICQLLEKRYNFSLNIKYVAAFLYALAVFPIQLSHFFAVDTFLNLFAFSSVYFSLSYFVKKETRYIVLSGIAFGAAIGSKISGVFILPLILFFLLDLSHAKHLGKLSNSIKNLIIFSSVSFVILKITNPYIFAQGITSFMPNQLFLENIKTLSFLSSKDSFYPPNLQWLSKSPIIFPLSNFAFFGLGVTYFLTFLFGMFVSLKTRAKFIFAAIILWIFIFFLYQGGQTVTTMRYFISLYPFAAIFSAIGIVKLSEKAGKKIAILTLIIISAWTVFFMSIYTNPHTRVEASRWIIKNIPAQSVILSEYWDDALPVFGFENYKIIQLSVFDPDSFEKWEKMNSSLFQGNYLILSSNRGWGSIPLLREEYPLTTKFYEDLFAGKLAYKKIAEFTSYPSLKYLGIPITLPDTSAEEAFSVYDHPTVYIFKKN